MDDDDIEEMFHDDESISAVREMIQRVRSTDSASRFFKQSLSENQFTLPQESVSQEIVPKQIGRFHIERVLGRGGYGVVLLAHDPQLNRQVALKVPRLDCLVSPSGRARFIREARAAALLGHPNIVSVYEAGHAGAVLYIAFEWIDGQSLSEWIKANHDHCDSKTIASLCIAIAKGVQHAHQRGIIHRDLKPSNVLIQSNLQEASECFEQLASRAKISDFGMAYLAEQDGLQTQSGCLLGTPMYAAPEQLRASSENAGPSVDVYGIGCILYELLTGRPPFSGSTLASITRAVEQDPPLMPRRIRRNLPIDLEAICLKCLEKKPGRRYPSAIALAEDLERFLDGRPVQARSPSFLERAWGSAVRHPYVTAFFIAILVGAAGIVSQWIRAERHRAFAERQTKQVQIARASEMKERSRMEAAVYAKNILLAQYEFSFNHSERALQLLEHCPERFRHWEWDYLKQNFQREKRNWSDLERRVRNVALTRDAKFAAGASAEWATNHPESIKVWDVESGETKWTLPGHASSIMDLSFRPDGARLASAGVYWHNDSAKGAVKVWCMTSGQEVAALDHLNAFCLSYSPNGERIAIGDSDGNVHVWDASSQNLTSSMKAHSQIVLGVSWNPSGSSIASCSRDGTLQIWDPSTNQLKLKANGLGDSRRIEFSPSGNELALGNFGGLVRLFSVITDELVEIARFPQENRLGAMSFSPDGRSIAISSDSGSLKLIDTRTQDVEREFYGHNGTTRDVCFDASGMTMATGGIDGRVKVWDLTEPVQPYTASCPYNVPAMSFISEHQVAIALRQDVVTGENRWDGRVIKVWNTRTREFSDPFQPHTNWLTCLSSWPNGRWLLTGSLGKTVHLWNTQTGAIVRSFGSMNEEVVQVAFTNDGATSIALDSDGNVRAWDTELGAPIGSWSSDVSSKTIRIATAVHRPLIALARSDQRCQLIDIQSGRNLAELQATARIKNVAISPDEKWLSIGTTNGMIELYELELDSNERILQLHTKIDAHTAPIEAIRFTPDNRRLLSTSSDLSIRLWDVESGQQVLDIAGITCPADNVSFSPSGLDLVAAPIERKFHLWTIDSSVQPFSADLSSNNRRLRFHREQLAQSRSENNDQATLFHANSILEFEPMDQPALKERGFAYCNLSRFSEALADLHLLPQSMFDPVLEHRLGLLFALEERTDELTSLTSKTIARLEQEKNPKRVNQLLWSLVVFGQTNVDYERLLPYADVLLTSSPTASELNTVGALYVRAGLHAKGQELLNKAMSEHPASQQTYDRHFLAVSFWDEGQPKKAIQLLDQNQAWIQRQELRQELDVLPNKAFSPITRMELKLLTRELRRSLSN